MIDIQNLRRAAQMLDADLRWHWTALSIVNIFAALLEAVGALGVFWLIGIVHDPNTAGTLPIVGPLAVKLGYDASPAWVIWSAIGVVTFYAAKNAFLVCHHYFQTKLPHEAYVRVSTELLRRYISTDYSFHLDRNSAEIIRNLMNSADVVFRVVLHNAITMIGEALMALAVICVLFATSPVGAIIAGGVLWALAWIIARLTSRRTSRWGREGQTLASDLQKLINQALGGIKEIKVLRRENYFLEQFHRMRARQARVICLHEVFMMIPRHVLESMFAFFLAGFVIFITTMNYDKTVIVPLLGLYGYVGIRLLPALARIATKIQRLHFGASAVDSVHHDYFKLQDDRGLAVAAAAPLPFTREIHIDDVTYSYPNSDRLALSNVSLTIPLGASVGIVGPSGGGKSTLVDVLLGLLTPNSGRILVDSVDVATLRGGWQANLGYVPQSAYLLDDTLLRNIAFGVPSSEIDESAVADAVRMAQLTDLVASLPKGLNTEIGERGVRLSGGQRQRIAIARALYRKPSVLVFDEATAALDNQTEKEVTSAIESLAGKQTIVIVAHRLTTVQNCDLVVLLSEGRVMDVGRYDELLSRNPFFRQLALAPVDRSEAP